MGTADITRRPIAGILPHLLTIAAIPRHAVILRHAPTQLPPLRALREAVEATTVEALPAVVVPTAAVAVDLTAVVEAAARTVVAVIANRFLPI